MFVTGPVPFYLIGAIRGKYYQTNDFLGGQLELDEKS